MARPSDLPPKIRPFEINCSAAPSAWHELPSEDTACVYMPAKQPSSSKAGTASYEVGQH